MSLEQHNVRFQNYWKDVLTKAGVTWVTGPAQSRDTFNTPYITLAVGCEKPEGYERDCWYYQVTDRMFRHFKCEFFYWLGDRDRIIWRTEPRLIEEEITEITGDIANREAVQDGLEAPRMTTLIKKRYSIHCRLTAYHS